MLLAALEQIALATFDHVADGLPVNHQIVAHMVDSETLHGHGSGLAIGISNCSHRHAGGGGVAGRASMEESEAPGIEIAVASLFTVKTGAFAVAAELGEQSSKERRCANL